MRGGIGAVGGHIECLPAWSGPDGRIQVSRGRARLAQTPARIQLVEKQNILIQIGRGGAIGNVQAAIVSNVVLHDIGLRNGQQLANAELGLWFGHLVLRLLLLLLLIRFRLGYTDSNYFLFLVIDSQVSRIDAFYLMQSTFPRRNLQPQLILVKNILFNQIITTA